LKLDTTSKTLSKLAQSHYENFPVGSLYIPREFRKPIRLVYAFARVADDFADEGDESAQTRVKKLDDWEKELNEALNGGEAAEFFMDLSQVIKANSMPPSLFSDLLEAFRMDARGTSYESFDNLLCYCSRSANPVGRIILHLFHCASEELCLYSDKICTALQLANFWQDLSVDIKRNRVYIPREDLDQFAVGIESLRIGTANAGQLLHFEIERTRRLFDEGRPLLRAIDKRFSFELRLTYNGGMRILEKVESLGCEVLVRRPAHSLIDWALIFTRSFFVR